MKFLLNDCRWQLKGHWPYVPVFGKSVELGNELMGVTEWLDAAVPGGVHTDLLKAGLIEDPYFEKNSLKCEWVEHRWWEYRTCFTVPDGMKCKNAMLVFRGVDCKGHFYLNRTRLGEHEGMYESAAFDVSGLLKSDEENELTVIIESAPQEMSQIGYTSRSSTQKSRFNYKWDFSTRLVNLGIWDDVFIEFAGNISLDDCHIITDVKDEKGVVKVSAQIKGNMDDSCYVRVTLMDEEANEVEPARKLCNRENIKNGQAIGCSFVIDNPHMWYPNGAGEQPLYSLKIEAYDAEGISDVKEYKTGIRSLEYRVNEGSGDDALPYTFVVNGKPVYIKGVNLAPFDHIYGCVTQQVYEKYIMLLKHANINMVRIWGGGLIEKECFYQLCDRNGIMVWQEFIQSSSGIDNIPSTDPHFLELLKATAIHAVKTKRNHVCLTVWSGGNELREDDEKDRPVTYNHPNIMMLKEVVEEYDPGRLFLPTSASGPNEFLDLDGPGTNHDVHGSWVYEGIEKHYDIYNRSDSLFHSEFGVNGMSSIKSLGKFLTPKNLCVTNMKDNMVWRHHGEWWDTYFRDKEIFGDFVCLEQFIKASQLIQSEGLRYILESNRRRKFYNSGSMVWQFNEPWPNVSNTCLVDYYGMPKMAYYWLRKAYGTIHISMRYERLAYMCRQKFKGEVYVHNSMESNEVLAKYEVMDSRGDVVSSGEKKLIATGNSSKKVLDIVWKVVKLEDDTFFIRLTLHDAKGVDICENLYSFSQRRTEIYNPLLNIAGGRLAASKSSTGYRVKNIGSKVCLFVYGIGLNENSSCLIDNNYVSLFPGEERVFNIIYPVNARIGCTQDIVWDYFNNFFSQVEKR